MLRALGLKVQHADGSRCARLFSEYYSTFQVGALWAELYREGAFMRNGDEKFELWFSLAMPAGSQLYEAFCATGPQWPKNSRQSSLSRGCPQESL